MSEFQLEIKTDDGASLTVTVAPQGRRHVRVTGLHSCDLTLRHALAVSEAIRWAAVEAQGSVHPRRSILR